LRFALAPSVTAAPSAALLVHTGGLVNCAVPWIFSLDVGTAGIFSCSSTTVFAPAVCLIGFFFCSSRVFESSSRSSSGSLAQAPAPVLVVME
jgi:hypothetical protein